MARPTREVGIVKPGVCVSHEITDESQHFCPCASCGQLFDMRDLSDVMYHEEPDHKPKVQQ